MQKVEENVRKVEKDWKNQGSKIKCTKNWGNVKKLREYVKSWKNHYEVC